VDQNTQIPADGEPEPPLQAAVPGDGDTGWPDYHVEGSDCLPEEAGYGHGV
jgi:hypothetical protein